MPVPRFSRQLCYETRRSWPIYYAVAGIVASSRVHVRMHHASDVVAGAALGAALGELARAAVPLLPPKR